MPACRPKPNSQTELDESAQQLEDAQQHVQIRQDRFDQEERRWAQLSHRLTIPTVPLVSLSTSLHHTC